MDLRININISLGDVPLLAEALRREIARLGQAERRLEHAAAKHREPGRTGLEINSAAAMDRKALEIGAKRERCEDLLKVLP